MTVLVQTHFLKTEKGACLGLSHIAIDTHKSERRVRSSIVFLSSKDQKPRARSKNIEVKNSPLRKNLENGGFMQPLFDNQLFSLPVDLFW